MALLTLSSNPFFTFTRLQPASRFCRGKSQGVCISGPVQCTGGAKTSSQTAVIVRRTASYQPSIWDHDYIRSLTSDYVGETYTRQLEKLKGDVKIMLGQVGEPLHQLELIDTLQRLGIHYHFGEEIKRILHSIYNNYNRNDTWKNGDLYATALEFRLLRQHGYHVPQDVFHIFINKMGTVNPWLNEDIKGILCLYEASYLSVKGENILEEARDFTRNFLEEYLERTVDQNDLTAIINHAMELPLHWRMLRLEARWFIDVYERSQGMNPILLELAKLDYNMVQATYQEDLKHASMWWRSTRLPEKSSFSRDRLVENFLWAVGFIFEPQFGYCRRMLTKLISLITTIDDVYDVYGTLDELELFTDAVDRWDTNAMEQLPQYMKICFLALYNFTNETAYDVLKEHDLNIISYLRKAWADLSKSYLVEAKWYHEGYMPSLQEYINNAMISISGPLTLVHAYFFITNPMTEEALGCLERFRDIIRWSSTIFRLSDDLGTSSDELKRGDVPKSIQCYMYETSASEDDARKYIGFLIDETWKKMNEERNLNSPFSQTFIGMAMDIPRMAQCIYLYRDGYGVQDRETKDHVKTLFIEPISPV
ncbi:(+)-alpha-phellandrene synthase [Vitis vinifera]|uniref:(+)-alpha-pinene synthase n=1 Tax=Vitis vinifera TaxID=29760 RepID=E5GAG4_VITVI|nr:(+)-alpha-phellandrene synthase [Vitis vinifera]ADR74203.1 (+)-alpha-pinene synthase [Vitis vinifera]|eukprot:NP_001268167.1 (+)-alpha-phellandrene synthase [Vitis vinifera]